MAWYAQTLNADFSNANRQPGWTAVFASEGTFFVVLVDYWAKGSVPEAALRKFTRSLSPKADAANIAQFPSLL
jgi:hypothetical protein